MIKIISEIITHNNERILCDNIVNDGQTYDIYFSVVDTRGDFKENDMLNISEVYRIQPKVLEIDL